ncbi:hypothetical protein MRX96_015960 [Rhipicephalus microplus]
MHSGITTRRLNEAPPCGARPRRLLSPNQLAFSRKGTSALSGPARIRPDRRKTTHRAFLSRPPVIGRFPTSNRAAGSVTRRARPMGPTAALRDARARVKRGVDHAHHHRTKVKQRSIEACSKEASPPGSVLATPTPDGSS